MDMIRTDLYRTTTLFSIAGSNTRLDSLHKSRETRFTSKCCLLQAADNKMSLFWETSVYTVTYSTGLLIVCMPQRKISIFYDGLELCSRFQQCIHFRRLIEKKYKEDLLT
jgi:hypothetical protein